MVTNTLFSERRPAIIKFSDGNSHVVSRMECVESLSDGVTISASIACHEELSESILGNALQILYKHKENIRRYNSILIDLTLEGYDQTRDLFFYNIIAKDPLALLDLQQQRRIFQNMTTDKILEDVFRAANISSWVKFSFFNKNQKKHQYCSQMHETDLMFVRRLMANEGWHYHIDHSPDGPIVIISDSNQVFETLEDENISWLHRGQYLEQFHHTIRLRTNKIALMDYSLDNNQIIQSGERKSANSMTAVSLSSTLYGLGLRNNDEIKNSAKLHLEAINNKKNDIYGTSKISTLSAGKKFRLIDHPLSKVNQSYIISHITHTILSDETGHQVQYKNSFRCIPESLNFRLQIPPRPLAHGLHTATVTGPKTEEIYTDKIGRVKVQFHWDDKGGLDEHSSCWLPVIQSIASKGFGLQFLPRIGDQVLVQYIEGNPDNPVIVGSLYKQESPLPWSSKTQSGIKTRSTPNGNNHQGNELRFEDQKDNESILIHAEKDLRVETNNDFISNIKGNKILKVEKNAHLVAKEVIDITGDKTITLTSKDDLRCYTDSDFDVQAGINGHIKTKSKLSISGAEIDITGMQSIKLTVGSSQIKISNDGITLSAPAISINSLGKAELTGTMVNIEGKAKTDIKSIIVTVDSSAMTEVKASALVNIQGAITKIN